MIWKKESIMSNQNKKFYITTTLPYVNAKPHVGFAMEIIRADVVARFKKSQGYDVFFNTGTDEHGAKLHEGAEKEGVSTQEYVDKYAKEFRELVPLLGISDDVHFIRTTDENHKKAAQEMWKRCEANGFIYKKNYKAKYCVGCELYKTESDLIDGKCEFHPDREVEIIDEENYFFKFSEFQNKLIDYYESHPDFVVPNFRFNEIKAFVKRGLEDFSISRLKTKMPWGVPVPGDDDHVMYVWFDALTNYISTLGWPEGGGDFKYWSEGETVQYCGKDNLRQQSAMWQAMLMSVGIKGTDHVIIDGFITSGGQKMSKSAGNVLLAFDIVDLFKDVTDFPEEVLRFILLHDVSSFEDSDLTVESIKASYQANLANGIGNLTNRILKMSQNAQVTFQPLAVSRQSLEEIQKNIESFDLKKAMEVVMNKVRALDQHIQETEPFKVIKTDEEKGKKLISELLVSLNEIGELLKPFLPKTSAKILECICENKMPEKPLFNRL